MKRLTAGVFIQGSAYSQHAVDTQNVLNESDISQRERESVENNFSQYMYIQPSWKDLPKRFHRNERVLSSILSFVFSTQQQHHTHRCFKYSRQHFSFLFFSSFLLAIYIFKLRTCMYTPIHNRLDCSIGTIQHGFVFKIHLNGTGLYSSSSPCPVKQSI